MESVVGKTERALNFGPAGGATRGFSHYGSVNSKDLANRDLAKDRT